MKCQGKSHQFLGHCDRSGKLHADGKYYCWQHDPTRLRRLAEIRWASRKAHIKKVEDDHDARIARNQLLESAGLLKPDADLLLEIIGYGGIRELLKLANKHAPKGPM